MESTEIQSQPNEPIRHHQSVRKQLIISLGVLLLLVLMTTGIILYGKGYRFMFQKGEPTVSKTGLLHVTSTPVGAEVRIDGHLTTSTNSTINLVPGKYTVTITKDGYNDWQKDVQMKKEVVSNADATLFPKAPTLQAISTFGIDSVIVDPSGTKLAFKISSQSAKKNGIYIFDMTTRNFPVLAGQSGSTQIVDDTTNQFSKANLTWSPDGKQLIAKIADSAGNQTYYLLKTDSFNDAPQDITATLAGFIDIWKTQRQEKQTARIKALKPKIQQFANKYFGILAWSPDDKKILYQASESAQMPVFIKPRRIGNNLLYERRDLKKGAVYIYDTTEDVNTRIVDTVNKFCTITDPTCTIPFTWFSDSHHLLYVHDKKISIVEDDGANITTMYAGPFIDHYAFPWPDGSKIVILTNLNNQGVAPTLYTIGLE